MFIQLEPDLFYEISKTSEGKRVYVMKYTGKKKPVIEKYDYNKFYLTEVINLFKIKIGYDKL